MTAPPTANIVIKGVGKRFPGVQALDDVNLDIRAGTVHAIMGENGAGKSTLMKILAGEERSDTGSIRIESEEVEIHSPAAALRLGISLVHQELDLVPQLTVAENIMMGDLPKRWGFLRRGQLREATETVLKELGSDLDPALTVGELSPGHAQLVEIARAVRRRPRLLILDEPTSSLGEAESQNLFRVVRRLRDSGISVLYVSHRMHEVASDGMHTVPLCDEVTVLRDGQKVGSLTGQGMTADAIIRLMVGREVSDEFPKAAAAVGSVVLEVNGLSRKGVFEEINLTVRAGEIVGMAGLVGSGRTEVARAVSGLDRAVGTVSVDGVRANLRSAADGLRAGIAYVSEDRKSEGFVRTLDVKQNITLAVLRDLQRGLGVVDRVRQQSLAASLIDRLGVQPARSDRMIETLSGGNQQKVALGRMIASAPRVLILDEPTRGVDVGSKAEIHRIIGELVEGGSAVLMISSELPEVLSVSDRIIVMAGGRISAEMSREEADELSVMAAATQEVNRVA